MGAVIADEQSRLHFDTWLRKRANDLTYLHDAPIPDTIEGVRATVFDFELKYDPYESIKEKIN